jgi:2,3-bisphosphoglycerate-dependent phosphoglycerate mutase
MGLPARLILVRHGQTVWNEEMRWQGQQDSPLTALGEAQAQELARRIAELGPKVVYSSDLGRALATARPIAAACAAELVEDRELRERNLGIFEGLTLLEIEQRHPEVWSRFKTDGLDYAMPNGESTRQRFERNVGALTRIASRHLGESVVVVGHVGTLDSAFRAALGLSLDGRRNFSRAHGSLHVLEFQAEQWQLITWGDVAHLPER